MSDDAVEFAVEVRAMEERIFVAGALLTPRVVVPLMVVLIVTDAFQELPRPPLCLVRLFLEILLDLMV